VIALQSPRNGEQHIDVGIKLIEHQSAEGADFLMELLSKTNPGPADVPDRRLHAWL
jgi:hypothetical protein